ncbi:hypothetical protein SARC_08497 [Sphaeroforma arctica JP610]|uniref:Uncharacterized protein n=1 Tax=Sphaeroforma arctica JP610 TaxID=667725 RepID=A0A0L0FQR5_9EUKA|nr:hypothetical protein SARC_08497 [Sphaeroforma arctica JP610]KNC79100.1 hypothetical protein SARC_08497 [Sphaeroforma arctica JP610]|eukprot:XP_014153002.1 hypothetical protein SARC_08497 [Sphaeroforma arctica JP610]
MFHSARSTDLHHQVRNINQDNMAAARMRLIMLNEIAQFGPTEIIYQVDFMLHPIRQNQGELAMPTFSLLDAAEECFGTGRALGLPPQPEPVTQRSQNQPEGLPLWCQRVLQLYQSNPKNRSCLRQRC